MCKIWPTIIRTREDERGFTLPELLTVIAILGILIAIAIFIWLGILEQRRVDAAANQVVADLRLAHSTATNQLTDWRVLFVPKTTDDNQPDYYMLKLCKVYDPATGSEYTPEVTQVVPRYLPDTVRIKNNKSSTANDNRAQDRWTPPVAMPAPCDGEVTAGPAPATTRTVEMNSNGTMAFFRGPANSICVTVDENPMLRVAASYPATSQVQIEDGRKTGSSCLES